MGVDDDAHAVLNGPFQHLHDFIGQILRAVAGEDEDVRLAQPRHLGLQRLHVLVGDVGTGGVQLRILAGPGLDVDAGRPFNVGEIGLDVFVLLQQADVEILGEPAQEAEGAVGNQQVVQNDGDVDALAAGFVVFQLAAVDDARLQRLFKLHVVIQRRIQCAGADHRRAFPALTAMRTASSTPLFISSMTRYSYGPW